jgi:hypothetical protein
MKALVDGVISPTTDKQRAFVDYIEQSGLDQEYKNQYFPDIHSKMFVEYGERVSWLEKHVDMTVGEAKEAWARRDEFKRYQQLIIRSIIRRSMDLPDFDYSELVRPTLDS